MSGVGGCERRGRKGALWANGGSAAVEGPYLRRPFQSGMCGRCPPLHASTPRSRGLSPASTSLQVDPCASARAHQVLRRQLLQPDEAKALAVEVGVRVEVFVRGAIAEQVAVALAG